MAVDPAWLQSVREANQRHVGLRGGLGDSVAPPPLAPAFAPPVNLFQRQQQIHERAELQAKIDQANQDALQKAVTSEVRSAVRSGFSPAPIPWVKVGLIAGAAAIATGWFLGRQRNPRRRRRRAVSSC